MKILVTGANGYIGSHVIKELSAAGQKVIACDFSDSRIGPDAVLKKIDILDQARDPGLFARLDRPENVVHLAWQDGFNHYAASHVDNMIKHFYFLKNMIDFGVKSVTVMGTAHEIGYHEGRITEETPCRPLSYYGIAKNTLRQLLFAYAKDKDVSVKWLRAYYITGDDSNNHSVFTKLLQAAKDGKKEFPFTKGTNQFDFIDIAELAKMIAAAAIQNDVDGIINVCSGEPTSMKDKVEDFIRQHHLDIRLDYGAFPQRKYDSPVVYGDNAKIHRIMSAAGKN